MLKLWLICLWLASIRAICRTMPAGIKRIWMLLIGQVNPVYSSAYPKRGRALGHGISQFEVCCQLKCVPPRAKGGVEAGRERNLDTRLDINAGDQC